MIGLSVLMISGQVNSAPGPAAVPATVPPPAPEAASSPAPQAAPSLEQLAELMVQRRAEAEKAEVANYSPRTRELLEDLRRTREFFEGKASGGWKGFQKVAGEARLAHEKDEKVPYPFPKDGPGIRAIYEHARELSRRADTLIRDSSLPARERFAVLRTLLSDVVGPLRAATIIQGPDAPEVADRKYFEGLIPRLPADLFSEGSGLTREKALPQLEAIGLRPSTPKDDIAACELEASGETALGLDVKYWLMKDAGAAGSAPTQENYARALKLTTLGMMLSQIEHHRQLTGYTKPIRIPAACREQLDGDLPEEVPVEPLDEARLQDRFEALMRSNGLSPASPEYEEAFITQDIGDPKRKGFLGYSPFERLHAAEAALGGAGTPYVGVEPAIDDRDGYEKVVESRASKIIHEIEKRTPAEGGTYRPPAGGASYPVYMPAPASDAADTRRRNEKIRAESEELFSILQQEDDARTLGPVPKALVARMDRSGAVDWREVVPAPIRRTLESTPARLPFPPAASPPAYRTWAVRELTAFLEAAVPRLDEIEKKRRSGERLTREEWEIQNLARSACDDADRLADSKGGGRRPGPPCWSPASPAPASGFLRDALERIRAAKLAQRTNGDFDGALKADEVLLLERNLASIWNRFRDRIPGATISEWEWLGSQMGSNPFAGVRLETLIRRHEAATTGDSRKTAILDATLEHLGLSGPALPFVANRVLDRGERKRLWASIRDDHDADNANLFLQRGWGRRTGDGVRYYEQLEKLASTRTLDRSEAMSAASACHLDVPVGRQKPYSAEVDEIVQGEDARRSALLRRIYEARGDRPEQERLFEEYARDYAEDDSNVGKEARQALLKTDFDLKRPLYRRLIQRAANQRDAELTAALTDLCNLKPDDHAHFKKLVLSTMKAQDRLNEALGLNGMPESVRQEIDRLSEQDWKELKMSGLAMGLFIGSALLLTVSTGGLAAPAVAAGAGVLSGAMAMGSVAVGSVVIPKMWLEELPNAEARTAYARAFEDLRLTDRASVERLEGEVTTMKRWGIGLNVLFAAPMVKPVAQTLQTGVRGTALMARAAGAAASSGERLALREAAAKAQHQAEAISAEYLFGYRKLTPALLRSPTALASQVWEEAARPLKLAATSAEQVTRDSAKLASSLFKDDPKQLEGFLRSIQKRIASRAARDPSTGPNFWRRSILERREAGAMIDRLLEALPREGVQGLLEKHADEFGELMEKIPRAKRDWAAAFTIEGVPGLGTRLLHLREISTGRKALIRELGGEAAAASPSGAAKTAAGGSLLREFRQNLLSRGPEGEARWATIRSQFQKTLGAKSADEVEKLLSSSGTLPPQAWAAPELRKALVEMEERGRVYTNVAEFDEWLSVKRLQKQVERIAP